MTDATGGPADRAAASPRITLRPPAPDDEAPFLALVQASAALHFPWVAAPDTPAAFHAYVDRAAREHDPYPGHVCRLICRTADGAVVGVANLNNVVWGGFCCASLGYYAFAPHAGQGYVREGVTHLLTHGFQRTGLHRVEAAVQPENAHSRALLAALGFRYEGDSPRYINFGGRWRDHQRWALTAEEWHPVDPPEARPAPRPADARGPGPRRRPRRPSVGSSRDG